MSFKRLTIIFSIIVFLIYFSLVASLFTFFDIQNLYNVLLSKRVMYAIKLSTICALVATFLSFILAIPAGYALARYNFFGKQFVDILLEVPLIVSPIALGAMLIILFKSKVGLFIENNFGAFIFEIRGIILAQFITSLGIATRMIKSVFEEINPRYEMVACSLGASQFYAFLTTTLPIAKNGLIATFALTFAKCIGEFGATMTFAGTMPMKTETLPIAIFLALSSVQIETTVTCILLLLIIGILTILLSKKFKMIIYD